MLTSPSLIPFYSPRRQRLRRTLLSPFYIISTAHSVPVAYLSSSSAPTASSLAHLTLPTGCTTLPSESSSILQICVRSPCFPTDSYPSYSGSPPYPFTPSCDPSGRAPRQSLSSSSTKGPKRPSSSHLIKPFYSSPLYSINRPRFWFSLVPLHHPPRSLLLSPSTHSVSRVPSFVLRRHRPHHVPGSIAFSLSLRTPPAPSLRQCLSAMCNLET